jgi:hypothetical protein
MMTEEICKIAVSQNGYDLRFVPEQMRIKKLSKIAVAKNGYALQFVPVEIKTEEVCKIAVAKNGCSPVRVRGNEDGRTL